MTLINGVHFSSLVFILWETLVSYTSNLLVQHDRQLLSTAVPTVNNNISMFTSNIINNVKKINISFQCKAQHAVLMTCSSRTVLHQSHINMLNLTLVLGRYTHTHGRYSVYSVLVQLWAQSLPKQLETEKVQFL